MSNKKRRAQEAPDPSQLAPKASAGDLTLHSRTIGVLPIINRLIARLELKSTLDRLLPSEDRRNKVSTSTAILLLVKNILISREPVYAIGAWASAFVPELLGLREEQLKSLNDDRVGRALDRLFDANQSDLAMTITRKMVEEFGLDLAELHNDSTTVRFYGDYDEFEEPVLRRGKTTIAIRQGHSKDHRPDLKQLLYILTVTDDGGVPVYFTTDDGNRPDDPTHVPTWNLLRELTGRADFLYIADCKLASNENLKHIHSSGGRFITILPKSRSEAGTMKQQLLDNPDTLEWETLYEKVDEDGNVLDLFKTLREEQLSNDGFRLLWIHSSTKATTDERSRIKAINRTVDELSKLRERLRSSRTRMRQRHKVDSEVEKVLAQRKVAEFLTVEVIEQEEVKMRQQTPGRPTAKTQYTREVKLRFDLSWKINTELLERSRRADGVFPLITNDKQLTAEEVLRAYKRQPIIEKRFSQLKTDFNVAPVYLKEVSRIESLLCVYFLSLVIQTLLERELRQAMERADVASIPLYPEGRACSRPTARRVIDAMASLSRHRLLTDEGDELDLYTDPTPLQKTLIKLNSFTVKNYGR